MANVREGDDVLETQKREEVRRVRKIVADTYTFVRSQEINRSLSGFTMDHYIEEAKRQIKGEGRAIRNAAGEAFGLRPTKLESLTSLEDEFRATLETAKVMAKAADKISEEPVTEDE